MYNKKTWLVYLFIIVAPIKADVILFDLGGTLVDIDTKKMLSQLSYRPLLTTALIFQLRHPLSNFKMHFKKRYLDALAQVPCPDFNVKCQHYRHHILKID